jgi:hypothetical protein
MRYYIPIISQSPNDSSRGTAFALLLQKREQVLSWCTKRTRNVCQHRLLSMLQSFVPTMGGANPTKPSKATEDLITEAVQDQAQGLAPQRSCVSIGSNCAIEGAPFHATRFVALLSGPRSGRCAERLAPHMPACSFSHTRIE